ncbi:SDR family NAD(P)-dependent oxidoreductase [Pseudooceanicola sp. MF1-13]|uniref:SDR family NAD(P)-dependent oxidoreductase n=1 Tax=Pseudooceanicola sp. MF1-13 TaxID=3379095 RepID=UPI003892C6DD
MAEVNTRGASIDMSGKVALVTGAASGIGKASALMFAQAGAQVLACDRNPEVSALAQEGRIEAFQMDAGAEADVIAALDRAEEVFGGIDVIFANAGITGGVRDASDHTPEIWAEVLRVNLIGPALLIQHGGPRIAARGGGAIIATASVAGMRANAGPVAYSASKAGVINLVQNAAYAMAGTGVRVNAICPGLVETEMTRPIYDYARATGAEGMLGARTPIQRGADPSEIASVALFLASPMASFVTGQAVPACGGLSASHPFGPRPDPAEAAKVIAEYRAKVGSGG